MPCFEDGFMITGASDLDVFTGVFHILHDTFSLDAFLQGAFSPDARLQDAFLLDAFSLDARLQVAFSLDAFPLETRLQVVF